MTAPCSAGRLVPRRPMPLEVLTMPDDPDLRRRIEALQDDSDLR